MVELRLDNISWGSICSDDYHPSQTELQRVCRFLGFQNIHPYVPYYYTTNPPSPLIWGSLLGEFRNRTCSSNQALSIACYPGNLFIILYYIILYYIILYYIILYNDDQTSITRSCDIANQDQ